MQAVIGELGWLVLNERIVDEDEGRLVLLKLSLEPVEMLFPKRTNVRMKIRRGAVLRAAKKIIKVNEFVTLVVQNRIRFRIELGLEESVAHLARNSFDIIVMVTKAQMYGHLKTVGNDLGIVKASRVLEIEIVVGGGIVMEVIADQEHLFNGGGERVGEIACRDETRSGEQNTLVILHSVLAAFDIKLVDDVCIGDERKVELVRRSRRTRLFGPESPGEQAAERCASERGKLSAVHHVTISSAWLENNLTGELQDASRESGTSSNNAERARPEAALRESVVGLVQKIEGFNPEIKRRSLRIKR